MSTDGMEACTMLTLHRLLIVAAGMALLANLAAAEVPPKASAARDSKANLVDLLGARDIATAASDLRKSAEAFERLGELLKLIAPEITKGMVEGSRNLAEMSRGFDPFGYKEAFATIREQSRTIQALQKAEIERLRAERKRPSQTPERRQGKTAQRKRGGRKAAKAARPRRRGSSLSLRRPARRYTVGEDGS
jgi:hypothetical protein